MTYAEFYEKMVDTGCRLRLPNGETTNFDLWFEVIKTFGLADKPISAGEFTLVFP